MGLFDFLTGNGSNNNTAPQQQGSGDAMGSYLGNLVDPNTAAQFTQARQQAGLLGLAAGLLTGSGPSRMPVPFGSALGQGLLGMSQMQGQLPTQALQAAQTSNQAAEGSFNRLKAAQLGMTLQQLPDYMKSLQEFYSGGGTPGAGGAPSSLNAPTITGPGELVKQYESNGNYNVGYGKTDLSKTPVDSTGFPIWEGVTLANGDRTHAAGAYQFEPATWKKYATPLGITDFSPGSQDAVFRAAYLDQGFKPWAPYNPRLAAAIGYDPRTNTAAVNTAPTPQGAAAAPTGSASPGGFGSPAGIPTQGTSIGLPGMSIDPARIAQAQALEARATALGLPLPDAIKQIAALGPQTALASGQAWAKVAPDIATAYGKPQGYRAGEVVGSPATGPLFGIPVHVPGVTASGAPTVQFVNPMQGYPQAGSPSASPVAPSVPGTNFGMGGAGLMPPRPMMPAPGSAPAPLGSAPQTGGLAPGGAFRPMPGATAPAGMPSPSPAPTQAGGASGPSAGTAAPPSQIVTGLSPQQHAEAEGTGKTLSEEYGNSVKAYDAAQKSLPDLLMLERALQGIQTGPTAEARTRALRYAQDILTQVGVGFPDELKQQIASGEIFKKGSTRLGYELAKTLGSREAAMIVQQAISSNPNLENSPEGNRAIIGLIKQGLQRDIDRRSFYDNYWNNNRSYAGAALAFDKAKPIEVYQSQVLPFKVTSPSDVQKLPAGTRYTQPGNPTQVYTANGAPNG